MKVLSKLFLALALGFGALTAPVLADTSGVGPFICSLGALNATCPMYLYGQGEVGFTVSGTWVGTLTVSGSSDGGATYPWTNANSTPPNCYATNSSSGVTTTSNVTWTCLAPGLSHLQLKMTAYTSGTATVTWFVGGYPPSVTTLPGGQVQSFVPFNTDTLSTTTNGGAVGALCMGYNGSTISRCYMDPSSLSTGWLRVSTGGSNTFPIAAAAGATTVVSVTMRRLWGGLVTTAGTVAAICYDNASAASGTIVWETPATSVVATWYGMPNGGVPLVNGLTCAFPASTPAVTFVGN